MPDAVLHNHNDAPAGANPQRTLVDFITGTTFEQLPPALVERCKRHILDTLGAGLAGAGSQVAQDMTRLLATEGAAPQAAVWGTLQATSARNAALLNGIAAHALELDDTGGCDHSGAVVMPALLAVLPLCPQPVSGRALILATVIGYDIARRVLEACGGYSIHNGAGWHSTATCGVFGAAAAAASLLGLSPVQVSSALGIAGSFSGGLWGFIHDGSQSKKLHAGRAAEGGVLAALSARQGISGPGALFDDRWGGFLATFAAASATPAALTQELARVWKLERCSIKPYASCRGTHAAIDAAGLLLDRLNVGHREIEKIEVRLCTFLNDMCGNANLHTLAAAQMSLPYAVAARLVFGHAGLDAYGERERRDPRLLAMMARIELQVDPALPSDGEPEVTLHTREGECLSLRVEIALGNPANPVSDRQLRDKFLSLAARVLPATQAQSLWARGMALEDEADIGALAALLIPSRKDFI
ncbi:MmgE/PrpD family protein [Acerihabitans arboris]|uniref:MmgE/PrpD family protein n=1 Tax=Acerihabitans arboris TaxID=2691583 RepID=A0A845SQ94_9GAMM|nr:MmgE/PrpD family protein [Acerihabitans arboris]NDL64761.1 MmgE/PrpD family protein [Acerihabitans arboris]